ncbi:hypothetical protein FB645_001835 [Coemansia sp. IMI 203386]|nr:hypothetical protein FB645_001835 [Coemansia sp. IMI 203386]
MNLSGLSYLQFLLVDAFVALYLFLHVHLSQNWSGIVPFSVLRQDPHARIDSLVKMTGFYCCLVGSIFFLVKDGIMADQEFDDVALCRQSVYQNIDVVPLDLEQLPDITKGLMLWNLGTGFHLMALGCAMYCWAASSLRQVLGNNTLMNAATGFSMFGMGFVGFIIAIATHFGIFNAIDEPSRARSVSRIVTSAIFLVFFFLLVWILLRLTRILKLVRTRDPYATAAIVSASHKHYAQHPMAMLRYLLSMQKLGWMQNSGILLAILLLVRAVLYIVFDISFLTPGQSAIRSQGANNVLTGLGTLSASLIPVAMLHLLFPYKPTILGDVFAKVAELEPSARAAFFDGQSSLGSRGIPVPKLSSTENTRSHSLSTAGDAFSRSRAPTAASLAVEKLMGSSMPAMSTSPMMSQVQSPTIGADHRNRSMQSMPTNSSSHTYYQQQQQQQQQQPPHPFDTDANNADGVNYLRQIPYIDRNTRENSFFSQGPWTQPVTRTFSAEPSALGSNAHNSIVSTTEAPGSRAIAPAGPFESSPAPHLEQLVRSNTGAELITVEGRQDMLRQVENKSSLALFADQGAQEQLMSQSSGHNNVQQSRSQTISAFIPLSSSNVALAANASANNSTSMSSSAVSNNSHPSGPSLHGEALQDSGTENDRPDSLISSYIRADNGAPLFKGVFTNNRKSSFVSEDYQYEPIGGGGGDSNSIRGVPRNPFEEKSATNTASKLSRAVDVPSVYIAEPAAAVEDNEDVEESGTNGDEAKNAKGAGPILIRKGSKASLRRKNTLERRRKNEKKTSAESLQNSSAGSSQEITSNNSSNQEVSMSNESMERIARAAEQAVQDKSGLMKKSRMSAFSGAPTTTQNYARGVKYAAQVSSAAALEEPHRDSLTINNNEWDPNSKHSSAMSFDTSHAFSRQQEQQQQQQQQSVQTKTSPSLLERHVQKLSPESDAASIPSSLFKHSLGNGSRQSTDMFSSISSLHTNATADAFYTPQSSMAQINASAMLGDANWHDALDTEAMPESSQQQEPLPSQVFSATSEEERPSTAPSRTPTASNYRYTLAAHEQTAATARARLINLDEDKASLARVGGSQGTGLRRAQTLRKARDSDVPAIESSIQAPLGVESTGSLISALPMPTNASHDDRMII